MQSIDIKTFLKEHTEEKAFSEEEKALRYNDARKKEHVYAWQYRGHHKKNSLVEIKNKMETEGRQVRCIDCVSRKKCPILRVNKYAKKPCNKFCVDLDRQSRELDKKTKRKS